MENVKQIISAAISSIENEKQRAIVIATENVTRDKVVAHNIEVDNYKANALAEIQQKYEQDRAEIIAKAEENKKNYATNEIETATAIVTAEFDKKIAELKAMIE